MIKPEGRPRTPFFSCGPCTKHPGWTPEILKTATLGRSHRSSVCKAKLLQVIERSREILGIPVNHKLAIVPASDTGAVEMALWSMLGPRPVTVLAWESFGAAWVGDATKELKLKSVKGVIADYGKLPDLKSVDWTGDVVFTWNGTASGVRVPNGDWIAADREGLSICDATSAVFAMDIPWDKIDVATWSWQKVMGGEAAHGMISLSPHAVARLESYTPPWPLPKIFRMTKDGKLNEALFKGETINTPSMMAVEDQIDALNWAEASGGLKGLIARTEANYKALAAWVERTPWVDFLAEVPETRSTTSVCLKIVDPWFLGLNAADRAAAAKALAARVENEGAGHDVGAYRDAPPGLRIWCGATVETADIAALTPWLDWAFAETRAAARS